jgi:multiple sugar transport system ATP-binding protein
MADLRLDNISKTFGKGEGAIHALRDVSLDVASGEFIVLLGPSGAGKTTTLRTVAGLEAPDAGRVFIGGRDVTTLAPALRDVTFVFQQYSLYPHLTVFDNLAFPLRSPMRPMTEALVRDKVMQVATMLRIDDKLSNPATKLSGGQMQRVAIGRALVREPAVTLMDEPLSSLDAKLRNDLRLELRRIQQDLGATMLYVTHDQTEALTLATRIGVLDHGQLVQVGSPREIYEDPISTTVAARLGSPRINLLPRAALGSHIQTNASTATVGVRAEHVVLNGSGSANGLTAEVRRIEILSDQRLVHMVIAADDGSAQALVSAGASTFSSLAPGQKVAVSLARTLSFDAAGQRLAA